MHTRTWMDAKATHYLFAVLLTALAGLLCSALPMGLRGTTYLLFFPAVVMAAALGGFGPGVLATIGSFLCVGLLFDITLGWVRFGSPVVVERAVIFLVGGTAISLVGGMQRAKRARDQRQARELDDMLSVLRESEELRRLALGAAQMGTWDYDPSTGHISCDRRVAAIFGGRPAATTYREVFEKFIHPEDAPRVDAAVRRALEPHGDGAYMAEYRVIWPDGSTHWVQANGQTLFMGEGESRRAVRMVGTAADITARKVSEEELRAAKLSAEQARAAAESANRAKDHFLAVLSHELRTPLTPVQMGVSMLQGGQDLEPRVRETLEMVRRHVEMEARLIDDLLDMTRIARGKIELSEQRVNLAAVLDRAIEVCMPDIEARALHFGVDLGPDAPYWVEADSARLQQVFWNLLKNAVKFTPNGGCVGIKVRRDVGSGFGVQGSGLPDPCFSHRQTPAAGPQTLNPEPRTLNPFVVIEVSDSGIGIEPEALARIFNAFEQAERSITRQFGGLGLGLAICKTMVELHGGTIEAQSEGRGRGATFRVRLPLCGPAAEPVESNAAPPHRAVPSLRVLLVEDHGVTAKMMRWVLTEDGHEVQSAGDVATALELAEENGFDLMVSDLGLPDGSGYDLLRQLRERGREFPAIALSGYGQEQDLQRSQEAGFAAHLIKPASRERLLEAVASVAAAETAQG